MPSPTALPLSSPVSAKKGLPDAKNIRHQRKGDSALRISRLQVSGGYVHVHKRPQSAETIQVHRIGLTYYSPDHLLSDCSVTAISLTVAPPTHGQLFRVPTTFLIQVNVIATTVA
jgi:hypothetical protein